MPMFYFQVEKKRENSVWSGSQLSNLSTRANIQLIRRVEQRGRRQRVVVVPPDDSVPRQPRALLPVRFSGSWGGPWWTRAEAERAWADFWRNSHANRGRKQHATRYCWCVQNVRLWTTLLLRQRHKSEITRKRLKYLQWSPAASLVFVMGSTSVDQAVRLVRQAVLQDGKRNYGEAARCYREAITSFRELRHSRASSKRLQELLDTKLGEFDLILFTKHGR